MLEKAYDHYKETCAICREQVKERNVLFLKMLLSLAGMFLLMMQTNEAMQIFVSYMKEKYKCNVTFPANLISTLIWIVLLYYTLGYYRISINLERQYSYIHKLENAINRMIGQLQGQYAGFRIEREGKAYLKRYPKLLDAADFIYKTVFPGIYLVLVILGGWKRYTGEPELFASIQMGIAICCVILTILFMVEIRRE